jgi:aspartyl-tRNA(Asn)/glutamyl-tRNA(Gln) amidotransferase subunit C
MGIDRAEVRRIARLAYLELPEGQERLYEDASLDKLAGELGSILDYVAQLDGLDLTGVEATSHGVPLPTSFRRDEVTDQLETERALAGAPERQGDAFAVPKIIE